MYRTCGVKETLTKRDGIDDVIKYLRDNDYWITIITSRPVHRHPQLTAQTIHWLDKNIDYDEVVFEDSKFISVLSKYPFLRFGVEDNRYYANLIARWGYKMFLLDNKYNQGELNKNVIRISDIMEIVDGHNFI